MVWALNENTKECFTQHSLFIVKTNELAKLTELRYSMSLLLNIY